MTTITQSALVGAWRLELAFTKGPRAGERETVTLTFLADGVIVHADEVSGENDQLPRGIGEWTAEEDGFCYWFNVVLNDAAGRPTIVVYVHGHGTLAADERTFIGSGGSEVYGRDGQLLASNLAEGHATRAEDRGALDRVGTTVLFENDRVRVWEMTLEPGETCDLHRHRHDYLMIYPDAALGRSSSRSRLERVQAGLVAFATVGADGLPPHQITNAGESRSTHYVVELLGPSAAATAQPLAHNGRVQVEHG